MRIHTVGLAATAACALVIGGSSASAQSNNAATATSGTTVITLGTGGGPGTPPFGKYRSYSYRFETPSRAVFFTGDTGPSDAVVDLARGADLYLTEATSPEDVIELFKKNGAWQSKTPSEQEGFVRHMHEEHVTPEDVGKMAAKAGVKAVVMRRQSRSSISRALPARA